MRLPKTCDVWQENACAIEDVTFERLRDFFRVKGKARNVIECTLPHLRLRVAILDSRDRVVADNIFHITDRRLSPGETCVFKLEGEWRRGMCKAEVRVQPYPVEEAR
jgi:hypothetical protein